MNWSTLVTMRKLYFYSLLLRKILTADERWWTQIWYLETLFIDPIMSIRVNPRHPRNLCSIVLFPRHCKSNQPQRTQRAQSIVLCDLLRSPWFYQTFKFDLYALSPSASILPQPPPSTSRCPPAIAWVRLRAHRRGTWAGQPWRRCGNYISIPYFLEKF